jgi:heptosyltransferase-2
MDKAIGVRGKGLGYKKILVVRLDRLGDVVLSTPALKAIRQAYPDSRISLMVRPYVKDAVEGNPYIDEVILYDKSGPIGGFENSIKLIRRLKAERFDLAVILHPTARTHWVVFLAGIPKRLGFDRKMGVLLTDRVPDKKHLGLRHEIDYTLGLLKYIGVKTAGRGMHIPLNGASEEKIDSVFSRAGLGKSDKIVTIHPGASCPSKKWPAERFAEAAGRIASECGARIAVITGPADREIGRKVASLIRAGCVDLSGDTTVADVASVLRRSALFISNDSGPVHMACAVGTPVIAIFGRSDRGLSPRRWGPSNGSDIVLHKDVGCMECLAHNCLLGFRCLDSITVDDVVVSAKELLK